MKPHTQMATPHVELVARAIAQMRSAVASLIAAADAAAGDDFRLIQACVQTASYVDAFATAFEDEAVAIEAERLET